MGLMGPIGRIGPIGPIAFTSPAPMTYDEAIAFWYGRIDYERRQPRPGDLKLDRMRSLLARLGDPHRRLRCVHVAGTKGKGSTCALLASVLRAAGYRTGLFTSPHLSDVSERVQIDGVPISRDEIAEQMSAIAAVVHELDAAGDSSQSPTFFEIITALAFLHFDRRHVDFAVLEVGLGGRFDSTNVCEPLVSIITNVSHDHTAILGPTLREIAFQKAGIIKQGVPVVTTAEDPEIVAVIEEAAAECSAPLWRVGRDFTWEREGDAPFRMPPVWIRIAGHDPAALPLGLFGQHQGANAAAVVVACTRLCEFGLAIPGRALTNGFHDVGWPARMELLRRRPVVVLDCAHNVASIKALVETLANSFPIVGGRHLVLALSSDKQIPEMLFELAPAIDHFHLTRYRSNPRSADPETVATILRSLGKNSIAIHAGPAEAWAAARKLAGTDDGIVVAGSVFLAGELRPIMVRECQS
jgi:dihydrofolate synthase / folylpolyglutamate synthase